mmetsp:Transcript_39877/g.123222  ORF Transcript_39877/g.123222 Transcript_39877/m.123222 type:complete len:244 (-) Transcript_39877:16-747(-)
MSVFTRQGQGDCTWSEIEALAQRHDPVSRARVRRPAAAFTQASSSGAAARGSAGSGAVPSEAKRDVGSALLSMRPTRAQVAWLQDLDGRCAALERSVGTTACPNLLGRVAALERTAEAATTLAPSVLTPLQQQVEKLVGSRAEEVIRAGAPAELEAAMADAAAVLKSLDEMKALEQWLQQLDFPTAVASSSGPTVEEDANALDALEERIGGMEQRLAQLWQQTRDALDSIKCGEDDGDDNDAR